QTCRSGAATVERGRSPYRSSRRNCIASWTLPWMACMWPAKTAFRSVLWSPLWHDATFTPASGEACAAEASARVPRATAIVNHFGRIALGTVGRSASFAPSGGAALGRATLEALDTTSGVHELLPPGVERVAVGADLHMELRLRGTCRELVAASAANVRLD